MTQVWESPGPVAEAFFLDDDDFTVIRGPIGSAKTSTSCVKLWRLASDQAPSPIDGKRHSRWAVIRNTSPELRTTTIKTWLEWFPEDEYGKFRWSPPFTHHIRRDDIDCEVIFLALDNLDDLKKALGLEITGAFFNEIREIPKTIVDQVLSRCGRYPSKRHGGPTWYGGFGDTNAPAHDHWLPIMAGWSPPPEDMPEEERLTLVKPPGWRFYNQPPGMLEVYDGKKLAGYRVNPAAENVQNLPPDYYERQIAGRGRSWIKVYILNELGAVVLGTPVFHASFRRDAHVVPGRIQVVPEVTLRLALDFGLFPAALFAQRLPNGRWNVIKELCGSNIHAKRFAPMVKAILQELRLHDRHPVFINGDPKGEDQVGTDGTTTFAIYAGAGLPVIPAPTNDITVRIEAVEGELGKMIEGVAGVQISEAGCPMLVNAMETGYIYGPDNKPVKKGAPGRYSHVADCLQYLVLGDIAPGQVMNLQNVGKVTQVARRTSPFQRFRAARHRRPRAGPR